MSNKKVLSGNEAVAHGAWRFGVKSAAAYPGTPSTQILENIAKFPDIYCEWSVNEKVAMEVVIGSSFAGARSLTAMKHVGLNVASDPLMTVSYTGVNAGLLIISADDPGMHSSQNEQDNRFYAKFAKIPMFEPSDSQESFEMVGDALDLSEMLNCPVLMRMTTRISHSATIVDLGDFKRIEGPARPYVKNVEQYVPVPVFGRKMRLQVEERMRKMEEFAETCPRQIIEPGNDGVGIITSGISYQYAKEAFPNASFLKLGFTYPLPKMLIRDFAAKVNRLYVVEEGEPYLEEQVLAMGIKLAERKLYFTVGELNPDRTKELAREVYNGNTEPPKRSQPQEGLPPRPPVLCPSCPHRGAFYALAKLGAVITGDIGCYSLAVFPPLNAMDTIICMGASIGNAHGFEKASPETPVAAVLGDSTFFHSGITGLLNTVYNRGESTVVVMDNRTTAMTGHQEHPGTGRTLMGEPTKEITIEQVARGLGVERVRVVDPYDLAETEKVMAEELAAKEASVVITYRPCVLYEPPKEHKRRTIVEDECRGCLQCLKLGCPALELYDPKVADRPNLRKVRVNPVLCMGCAMCQQVCRFDAIKTLEEEGLIL